MSYGGFSGFGAGGASTDVGMSGAGDLGGEGGMTQAVPEQGSGADPNTARKPMPQFQAGSGQTPNFEAKRHDTTDLDQSSPRQGFQRLAEVGPRAAKNYGTP